MKKEYLFAGAGFVAGVLIAWAIFSFAPEQQAMGGDMTMAQMSQSLEGKSGDDFDMAFIDAMIVHHEGAIAMARLAKQSAGHSEISTMADNIISAQESEITLMKTWKEDWSK